MVVVTVSQPLGSSDSTQVRSHVCVKFPGVCRVGEKKEHIGRCRDSYIFSLQAKKFFIFFLVCVKLCFKTHLNKRQRLQWWKPSQWDSCSYFRTARDHEELFGA